jgi:hypothetical protein
MIFSAIKQIVEIESENDSFLCSLVTGVVGVFRRIVELLEMKVFAWPKDMVF